MDCTTYHTNKTPVTTKQWTYKQRQKQRTTKNTCLRYPRDGKIHQDFILNIHVVCRDCFSFAQYKCHWKCCPESKLIRFIVHIFVFIGFYHCPSNTRQNEVVIVHIVVLLSRIVVSWNIMTHFCLNKLNKEVCSTTKSNIDMLTILHSLPKDTIFNIPFVTGL